ncbi:hypothetical protein H5410_043880, partial [Solanum commersonii]
MLRQWIVDSVPGIPITVWVQQNITVSDSVRNLGFTFKVRQNKIQESKAMVPMTTKVNDAKELKSLEPGSKFISIGTRRGEG